MANKKKLADIVQAAATTAVTTATESHFTGAQEDTAKKTLMSIYITPADRDALKEIAEMLTRITKEKVSQSDLIRDGIKAQIEKYKQQYEVYKMRLEAIENELKKM